MIIPNNLATYQANRDLIPVLLYMQTRGIKVDTVGMAEASTKLTELINLRQIELNELTGVELNINSPKQLKEYFYETKRLTPYKDRKSGLPTVDEEALTRIARKGFPEAHLILEIRQAKKLNSTYLQVGLGEDNRLRSSFGFTRSGRLTSSQDIFGQGLNIQTLPHPKKFYSREDPEKVLLRIDFRKFLKADDDYIIYNLDKAQAENRIVGYIAPDINMIDAFEQGIDIHKRTASIIFNKPVDQISDLDGSCSLGNGTRSERYFGKEANHALNYGLGTSHFALRLQIKEVEAQMIKDKYFKGYPGVKIYHNWVKTRLREKRNLMNCFGRVYEWLDRIGDDNLSDALYFIPQSSVADMINRWGLIYIWNNRKTEFRGLELLNQVHDSIVYQLPISLGWKEHWRQTRLIVDSLNKPVEWGGRKFVIPTDLKLGLDFSEQTELKGKNFNEDLFQEAWRTYV